MTDGPAVTTEALSAVPVPPRAGGRGQPAGSPDPVLHPGAAARALPAASGGEAAKPDLAEISSRAAAGIRAVGFDVALPQRK